MVHQHQVTLLSQIRNIRRRERFVLGDPMVHPIKGYDLKTARNTRDSVFVKSTGGATINDKKFYTYTR